MVQRIKKDTHEKQIEKRNLYIGIFILIIMLSSIVGFAMMSGSGEIGQNNNQIPKELAFKEVEQDGQVFWVAIKNHEMFVFDNIDGFENRTDLRELATQIKLKKDIKIYVDEGFESSDSEFMINKILVGLQINQNKVLEKTCDENTLVLTNNASFEGNCMKLISNKGEEYTNTNILVYHLVQ